MSYFTAITVTSVNLLAKTTFSDTISPTANSDHSVNCNPLSNGSPSAKPDQVSYQKLTSVNNKPQVNYPSV